MAKTKKRYALLTIFREGTDLNLAKRLLEKQKSDYPDSVVSIELKELE